MVGNCRTLVDRCYLEVTQPPLVALFERNWDLARIPPTASPNSNPLSSRERLLVTLLAAGHSEVSAARRLWTGPRSVTDVTCGLRDRLGVENRFKLGLRLGTKHRAAPPPPAPNINPRAEHW
jgi:DNA-binding NarL/FixJ family response regulator